MHHCAEPQECLPKTALYRIASMNATAISDMYLHLMTSTFTCVLDVVVNFSGTGPIDILLALMTPSTSVSPSSSTIDNDKLTLLRMSPRRTERLLFSSGPFCVAMASSPADGTVGGRTATYWAGMMNSTAGLM